MRETWAALAVPHHVAWWDRVPAAYLARVFPSLQVPGTHHPWGQVALVHLVAVADLVVNQLYLGLPQLRGRVICKAGGAVGQGGPRPPAVPGPLRSTRRFRGGEGGSWYFLQALFLQSRTAGRATAASHPCGNGPRIPQQSPARSSRALRSQVGLRHAGAACREPASSLTFILPGLPKAGDEAGPASLESLAVHGKAGWANLSWRET